MRQAHPARQVQPRLSDPAWLARPQGMFKSGDKVQVLQFWARGMDPFWFSNYEFVGYDEGRQTGTVRDVLPGALSGVETSHPIENIRFLTYGPRKPTRLELDDHE